MAVKIRKSEAIEGAKKRLTGLTAVDPTKKLDLGNGHTIPSFEEVIASTQTDLDNYNDGQTKLAALKNKIDAAEKLLNKKSSAMLTGVKQKFGEDSDAYEQCGGTRESERKPSGPKPKPKPGA